MCTIDTILYLDDQSKDSRRMRLLIWRGLQPKQIIVAVVVDYCEVVVGCSRRGGGGGACLFCPAHPCCWQIPTKPRKEEPIDDPTASYCTHLVYYAQLATLPWYPSSVEREYHEPVDPTCTSSHRHQARACPARDGRTHGSLKERRMTERKSKAVRWYIESRSFVWTRMSC